MTLRDTVAPVHQDDLVAVLSLDDPAGRPLEAGPRERPHISRKEMKGTGVDRVNKIAPADRAHLFFKVG